MLFKLIEWSIIIIVVTSLPPDIRWIIGLIASGLLAIGIFEWIYRKFHAKN